MRVPAPRTLKYVGTRLDNEAVVRRVDENGRKSRLNPRFDLMRHSPTGFEWGYHGSGPAQLALAMVADATGDDGLALRVYQTFKRQIIGELPKLQWELEAGNVADFARTLDISPEPYPERIVE